MFYLAAGFACMIAAAFAGGRIGFAAAAAALAGFGYAFLVYRWWVPPAAAAGGTVAGYRLSRALHRSDRLLAVGLAGAVLAVFSLFGPADGLF